VSCEEKRPVDSFRLDGKIETEVDLFTQVRDQWRALANMETNFRVT
jgi:hypothetical protein